MNFEKLSALVALATIGSFLLDAVIAIYRLCKKANTYRKARKEARFTSEKH